jgi:hypothetical protein
MTIKKKTIITRNIHNQDIWFNDCGKSQWVNIDTRPAGDGYKKGVQPSDACSVYETAKQLIDTNNPAELKDLLASDFIYPGYISSFKTAYYESTKGYHEQTEEIYAYRSNIEALMIDHFDKFQELVTALINKSNPELYAAFVLCLQEAGFDSLLTWDEAQKRRIDDELYQLEQYGSKLLRLKGDNVAHEKGQLAREHAEALRASVAKQTCHTDTSPQSLLTNLQFKLNLVKNLHAKDDKFGNHRGWKCIATNLCSFLMTAGLANAVNYAISGHVFFYDKTETQKKIAEAHAAIGLNPDDEIDFSTPADRGPI